MTALYLRKASLTVSGKNDPVSNGASALDLSAMQFRFEVKQADIQTPNNATIRVYNLSDATAQTIQKEFSRVVLQAGYQDGPYGVIFDGQIKQVRRGRESAVDTYLDILAQDADEGLNFAVTNTSLAAGSTPDDAIGVYLMALADFGISQGFFPGVKSPKLPRGKVFFGMARDGLRNLVASMGYSYSVQNGKLTLIPLSGYVPGTAVALNSKTGMIGIPEQTEDGIRVRSLLNPNLGVGSQLQINEKDIQQAAQDLQYTALPINPTFPGIGKDDGVYRIFVINHSGDTRGNDWYSDIVCLSIDPTVSQGLTPGLLSRGQL